MGSTLWSASDSSASWYVRALMKWETNAMDSSLKNEIDDGGSLLNRLMPGLLM